MAGNGGERRAAVDSGKLESLSRRIRVPAGRARSFLKVRLPRSVERGVSTTEALGSRSIGGAHSRHVQPRLALIEVSDWVTWLHPCLEDCTYNVTDTLERVLV